MRNGANLGKEKWNFVLKLSFDHLIVAVCCILSKLFNKEIGI